jgi:hypothetical protein
MMRPLSLLNGVAQVIASSASLRVVSAENDRQ